MNVNKVVHITTYNLPLALEVSHLVCDTYSHQGQGYSYEGIMDTYARAQEHGWDFAEVLSGMEYDLERRTTSARGERKVREYGLEKLARELVKTIKRQSRNCTKSDGGRAMRNFIKDNNLA